MTTSAPDPLAPVVDLATAAAAVLVVAAAGWLAVALALTVVARTAALGEGVSRCADRCLGRIAPTAVRRALAVAVGVALSVGTAPAHAAPAHAAPTHGHSDQTGAGPSGHAGQPAPTDPLATSLDWPDTRPATPATHQGVTTPVKPAVTPADRSAATTPAADVVVVRVGDSLWEIAERALRAQPDRGPVGAPVTAAQVSTAWPQWWQANRDVLGDDPDLIHPGTRLTAPPG